VEVDEMIMLFGLVGMNLIAANGIVAEI